MTSGELGCVQRPENASTSHRIIFHDDPHLFPRTADNPHRPGAFFDDRDRRFARAPPAELPRGIYYSPSHTPQPPSHIWNPGGDTGSDDEDGEADGFVGANAKHASSCSVQSSSDGARANDGTDRRDQMGGYENAIAVVEPDSYCPQVCHGAGVAQKEIGVDNGYGFRGRDPEESLRAHLSDPITGVLMDDAVILRCGHSYSSSGMQHIYRMLFGMLFRHFAGSKNRSLQEHQKGKETGLNRTNVVMMNHVQWTHEAKEFSFHLLSQIGL